MKNLKKVLALALAFALSLSVFASAASFTDQASIDVNYVDDVNMLVELGILGGYPDGSFGPDKNITRAEMTKLVYALKYGEDASEGQIFAGSASTFTDVEGNANVSWAKGYINYCANQGIIGGVGNNKFNPNGNVTVAEAAKMLLVTLGCDAEKEGYGGSNWMGNVVADAMELGVFDGWKGNPAQPATRQLVAKLMANTIFTPVYVYNPVTGVGSQLNPLNNTENEYLGEKILGLNHVQGIVVANENLYINYGPEGERLYKGSVSANSNQVDAYITGDKDKDLVVDADQKARTTYTPGITAEGYSTIYFETSNGTELVRDSITINYPVADELIGNKVDVYYTNKDNQIKVIGEVLVNSDTVVYDVAAADIDIIPNGDSKSTSKINPYISIIADGQEIKVKSRQSEVKAVTANTEDNGDLFADYFYFGTATDKDGATFGSYTGELARPVIADDAGKVDSFIADLGENRVDNYRVVSVDGGNTVSYIFRTSEKALKKVAAYSESLGTITLSGVAAVDLEDVIIKGEIAKGDYVMAWYQGEKLVVEATETAVGEAVVVDDETISISDKEYKIDTKKFPLLTEKSGVVESVIDYFRFENNNNEATEYVLYNGYVVRITGEGVVADASQYAVVLDSDYDEDEGAVKVRLGFADETSGVYTVAKYNGVKIGKNSETLVSPKDYMDDQLVGYVFRFTLGADSSVNLYQDTKRVYNETNVKDFSAVKADDYLFYTTDGEGHDTEENAVLFLIYGGAKKNATDEDKKSVWNYERLSHTVWKFADLKSPKLAESVTIYNGKDGGKAINSYGYVLSSGYTNKIVAASMPAGDSKPYMKGDGKGVAYVLNTEYKFNSETGNFYAEVAMIDSNGLIEKKTNEQITDILGVTNVDDIRNGDVLYDYSADTKSDPTGAIERGTLVTGKISGDVIEDLSLVASKDNLKRSFVKTRKADGYYYATVVSVGTRAVTAYPWDNANITKVETGAASLAIVEDEDDFITFAIDGEMFVEDGEIEVATKGEEIPVGGFNAIIHIEGGRISKVISLYNNY